jgi:acyl-coenzyme A synthetase/AMP-(fatty) acid ligase
MLKPLLSHSRLDEVFAWRKGVPLRVADFLRDIQRVADAMPAARHVLNFCQDRYHFAVGFGAAMVADKLSLLPSTRTADTLGKLQARISDLFVLTDSSGDSGLPCLIYPTAGNAGEAVGPLRMPMIESNRVVAQVFTSGSTGEPMPHAKTWGNLIHCIQNEAAALGLAKIPGLTLVGTVPAQHMYGFESTLLLAFHGNVTMSAAHPFYPADIVAELASVPAPRLLVSTPVHLRALLSANIDLPPLAGVLCATAPLSTELAIEIESRFGAPLQEIYGATETGQIATRRTALTDAWELFSGIALQADEQGGWLASGGHIAAPCPLSDILEPLDAKRFRLIGRHADMVNIAGKRSSLAYLNHHLCAIPGVCDGSFFLPDHTDSSITRLMAFVVAPDLTRKQILDALRQRIDPAFMPRPLILLDALPRNGTGKLPHQALAELAAFHVSSPETAHDATL